MRTGSKRCKIGNKINEQGEIWQEIHKQGGKKNMKKKSKQEPLFIREMRVPTQCQDLWGISVNFNNDSRTLHNSFLHKL